MELFLFSIYQKEAILQAIAKYKLLLMAHQLVIKLEQEFNIQMKRF